MEYMPTVRTHKMLKTPCHSSQPKYSGIKQRDFLFSEKRFLLLPHKLRPLICLPLLSDSQKKKKNQQTLYYDPTQKKRLFCSCKFSLKKWSTLLSFTTQQMADLHISSYKQYQNRPWHHRMVLYVFGNFGDLKHVYIDIFWVHI